METGKKIVSVMLILTAAAAIVGGALYSLCAMDIIKLGLSNAGLLFTFSTIAVIGGYATLGLSIISIIMSCVGKLQRPVAVVGISGFLCGAAAFLMMPFMSLSSAIQFAMSMPSLLTSSFYTEGAKYFGFGMVLFAVIALILAITDLAKTNRGE